MKDSFDIVVAGAGMIGLTVAALLAQSAHRDRLRITVIDSGARPTFDLDQDVALRVSAVSIGSTEILTEIGAWSSISSTRACAFRGMRVWDAGAPVDRAETLCFDAGDFAVPELGFIVENALIRDALLDRIDSLNVDLRFATAISNIESAPQRNGFDVLLEGGESLTPDLLIGADGAGSVVRRGAAIPVRAWQYPQSALVTHVRPERDHRRIAWQRFLKDGPIALLPLEDGRASVVWSTTPEHVQHGIAASDAELGRILTESSDAVLGALTIEGPRGSFPLRAQHALSYILPGLVLIGDAAHSVHPLAGQGANLGFADARALADAVIGSLEREEYPGDLPTLRRYERARKGANAIMLHFIDSLNRLFINNAGLLPRLRTRGMRLFNRSGPIRRRAVQVALGIKVWR